MIDILFGNWRKADDGLFRKQEHRKMLMMIKNPTEKSKCRGYLKQHCASGDTFMSNISDSASDNVIKFSSSFSPPRRIDIERNKPERQK